MTDCMSLNKCKSSCSSMGASSYRWFHDGCCQCVGPKCADYGISESRCRMCPLHESGDSGSMRVDVAAAEHSSSAKSTAAAVAGEDESHRHENTVKAGDKVTKESAKVVGTIKSR